MDHSTHSHLDDIKPALNPLNHTIKDYIPLLVVFGFILLSSIIYVTLVGASIMTWMNAIMGFFFLFFALFKFIDLPSFAEGYREYDLIAKHSKIYSWTYPFIEIVLATLYLLGVMNIWLYVFTAIIMLINVAGIGIKLAKREKFMCMCLSTVLKVPLTTVSLIEYASMGIMAVAMIGFVI